MKSNKGQLGGTNLVYGMFILMIVGFLGIVSITVYDSVRASTVEGMNTASATNAAANFTANFLDGEELASNLPIVIAASLLLTVIIGFVAWMRM